MRTVAVSVVIPALNEADNLRHVLRRIPRDVHEVILVDGLSVDDTIAVARDVMPNIRVVTQDARGKGAALRAGFEAASGDIVVHLDADGSTDPAEIPAFVGALLAGADYAKGTRFIQGAGTTDITFVRRLGNWGFVKLANLLFGTHFSDITYGYNAVWKHHRDKLAPEIDGWAHEIVGNIRAVRHGLHVVEVASRESPRLSGQAKLRAFPAGWAILMAIVAERFRQVPAADSQQIPAPLAMAGTPYTSLAQPIQLRLLDGNDWASQVTDSPTEDRPLARVPQATPDGSDPRLRPVMMPQAIPSGGLVSHMTAVVVPVATESAAILIQPRVEEPPPEPVGRASK